MDGHCETPMYEHIKPNISLHYRIPPTKKTKALSGGLRIHLATTSTVRGGWGPSHVLRVVVATKPRRNVHVSGGPGVWGWNIHVP